MENNPPPFGPVLRHFRQEKNLSQEEVAALVDVSASHISRLESDRKKPSLGMIFKLAGALGIRPYELVKTMEDGTKTLSNKQ